MTVKVGCRVLNGLQIKIHFQDFQREIKLNGPSNHGDWAFDGQGRPLRSGNVDNHSFISSQSPKGPYGITVIQDDEWAAIQKAYADADWLQRGMVFKVTW